MITCVLSAPFFFPLNHCTNWSFFSLTCSDLLRSFRVCFSLSLSFLFFSFSFSSLQPPFFSASFLLFAFLSSFFHSFDGIFSFTSILCLIQFSLFLHSLFSFERVLPCMASLPVDRFVYLLCALSLSLSLSSKIQLDSGQKHTKKKETSLHLARTKIHFMHLLEVTSKWQLDVLKAPLERKFALKPVECSHSIFHCG